MKPIYLDNHYLDERSIDGCKKVYNQINQWNIALINGRLEFPSNLEDSNKTIRLQPKDISCTMPKLATISSLLEMYLLIYIYIRRRGSASKLNITAKSSIGGGVFFIEFSTLLFATIRK